MRCSRTRGKKGEKHADPLDLPRRRANKQRGHGTYDNDRPPIVGTVGRHSGQCRLRVRHHADGKTLPQLAHGYTRRDSTCYTDEWQGYNRLQRPHRTVCHGQKEWARDDDGDGTREVHTNTLKACGPRRAIFCVRFVGFIRNICITTWRCANMQSISSASVLRLLPCLSLSTDQ